MVGKGVCAVLNKSSAGVGVAFLIEGSYLLTCAHVVNSALGLDKLNCVKPEELLTVRFNGAAGTTVVEVAGWMPPLKDPANPDIDSKDLALLKLKGKAPDGVQAHAIAGCIPQHIQSRTFDTFGFPVAARSGQSQEGYIGQLTSEGRIELLEDDAFSKKPFIRPGFSGGPVSISDSGEEYVAAVIVSSLEGEVNAGYGIPIFDALPILVAANISLRSGVEFEFPHLKPLSKKLKSGAPDKRFELRLSRADSTEQIQQLFRKAPLASYPQDTIDAAKLLDIAEEGPVLIQSPGGAGKSTLLSELFREATQQGLVTFWLDLAAVKVSPPEISCETLFESSAVTGDYEALRSALEQVGAKRIVILVDRLNEGAVEPEKVLRVLLRITNNDFPGTRLIAASRVKRLSTPEMKEFTLVTLLPLPTSIQKEVLGDKWKQQNATLFSKPFFLNMQLNFASDGKRQKVFTRAEMFKKFFADHGGLTEGAFVELSKFAFDAYKTFKSTVFPAAAMQRFMNTSQMTSLDAMDGILLTSAIGEEQFVEFQHQLLHDFLAGNHLALIADEQNWNWSTFDAATLTGASFESIEFSAELLQQRADEFLVRVYDWNYMAVIECIRNLDAQRHGAASPVSKELKDAVYALNVLRKFDRFEHTRKRITSVLQDLNTSSGLNLAASASVEEVKQQVAMKFQPPSASKGVDLGDWKTLFLSKGPVRILDLERLIENPFISWTAVNVYHNLSWDDGVGEAAMVLYKSARKFHVDDVGFRWRIVHLLGGRQSISIADFLMKIATDANESIWVRYGAVRSYVETVSALPARVDRQHLLGRVSVLLESNAELPWNISQEIMNTAVVAEEMPDGWAEDYGLVLQAGLIRSKGKAQESDAWERRMKDLQGDAALQAAVK